MSAPEQQDTKVAAAWFAGLLTLALGGAGLLIAALAVGAERAWSNGAVEGERARERRGSWLDNQRAWLDQDHARRTARSKTYGDWLRSGADPQAAPTKPSWWQRMREAMRRNVAHTAIAGNDFRTGFRDGWAAADQTRRDGGSFREVARTRPTPTLDPKPDRDQGGLEDDWLTPDPDEHLSTTDDGQPAGVVHADDHTYCLGCKDCRTAKYGWWCDKCNTDHGGFPAKADAKADAGNTPCRPTEEAPATAEVSATEGDIMGDTTTAAAPTAAKTGGPTTESNATVLRGHLQQVSGTLGELSDLTDALAKVREKLHDQVMRSNEFATSTGQSAQARQSLDEANAVSAAMGQHLGNFSEGAVGAQEQITQASDGLRVAEHAEDDLRASGADGRAVAPAGANA